jgi:hypothetical protein
MPTTKNLPHIAQPLAQAPKIKTLTPRVLGY